MASAGEDTKQTGLLRAAGAEDTQVEDSEMPPLEADEARPKDSRVEEITQKWEHRGTALGLLLDVGFAAGGHIFLLMVILYGVWGEPRWQTPCPDKGDMFSICLCEYTKTFILCFPEIALSALLLLVGRNLLQKRLYYGLLKAGGVIEFTATNPLKDPFMLALLSCYCHILLFLGLILTGVIEPPKLGNTGGDEGADQLKQLQAGEDSMGGAGVPGGPTASLWADEEKMLLVLELAGFIVVPGGLCVIFLFLAYDIEQSLVPLGRFVQGAHTAEKEAEEEGIVLASSLETLTVLEDDDLAVLVNQNAEAIRDASAGGGNLYKECIRFYKEARESRANQPGALLGGLQSSLWPGQLLNSSPGISAIGSSITEGVSTVTGGSAGGEGTFRWLWRVFFGAAIWISIVMLIFFVERAYRVGLRGWAGQLGVPDGPRLLVEAAHLAVIMLVLWRICTATFSCLAFPPLPKTPVGLPGDAAFDPFAMVEGGPQKRVPGKGRRQRCCDYD